MKKIILLFVAISFVSILAGLGQKNNVKNSVIKRDSSYALLNKKLPPFRLKDLKGNTFSSSQLLGKPAMINFWFIGCAPCVAEFPFLTS